MTSKLLLSAYLHSDCQRPMTYDLLIFPTQSIEFHRGGVEDGSKLSTYFRHVGPFQVSRLDIQRQLYPNSFPGFSAFVCKRFFLYSSATPTAITLLYTEY